MDSNNVASKRPSKKRRKSAEEHPEEVQGAGMQRQHVEAKSDAVDGGDQDAKPRKKKKRKTAQNADAAPATVTMETHGSRSAAAADDAEDVAIRSKEEKRQRRRANKARNAREAAEATEAPTNEDAVGNEAARETVVDMEDMEVTQLPTETTPIKQERPKSPNGIEWGRQEVRQMLKRKQMEELVLSGRARWHKLPNDKWSIRYYQPGEAPAPAELSPEQKRRHASIKQEIATYEHTLQASGEQERKRRRDAEKENTAPVESDAVAGAVNDEVEVHTAMDVSPVGKPKSRRKKRRRSGTSEAPVAGAVSSQPEHSPEELLLAPGASDEQHKESASHTTSRKRKSRRSADQDAADGAEISRDTGESSHAARPMTSNKKEHRLRTKSKRVAEAQIASDIPQHSDQTSHVQDSAEPAGQGSPEQPAEPDDAPAVLSPGADNKYASTSSRKSASAERVETWLDSHDKAAPADLHVAGNGDEGERESAVELPKPRKRRKRSSNAVDEQAAYKPQPDPESHNEHEANGEPVQEVRKPKRTKTRRVSTEKYLGQSLAGSLQLAVPETTTGTFTAQEQEISDRIFDEVLQRNNHSEAELKAMIKDWRNAGIFKMEIEAALPNRKKDQVRKFCQRRYHAHERGPWTSEQDQALMEAHAKYPGKWSQIADLVDRFSTDCKDRWTNHLQPGDNRELGPWNQAEEDALVNAVEECITKIKKSRRKDKTLSNKREDLEALVDWNTVAEMLGGKRVAGRCREKYQKLMARLTKTGSLSQELPASQLQDELNDAAPKSASNKSRSKIAANTLKSFEIGDYYDAFVEVHTAVKDHTAQYHDEQMLLWSIVAQNHPASRFNVSYLGASLRRVAIEKALNDWEIDSKKTRRKLDEAPSIPASALLLAKWVEKRSGHKMDTLPRKYMPELIGKTKEEIRQFKKQQQERRRAKKLKANEKKSKDYVASSDENEEAPLATKATREQRAARRSVVLSDDGKASDAASDVGIPDAEAEEETASRKRDEDDSNEDEDGEQPEVDESDQDEGQSPKAAHEVSDTELDSTHEKVFAASQAARPTQGTQEVLETQPEAALTDDGEASKSLAARAFRSPDNDMVVSSVNSRVSNSPSLSPADFLQRCRDAGRSQHGEYTSKNRKTYGRQSGGRQR